MNAQKIHNAIIFATLKHKSQKRKGTDIPYIVHPMEVMQILTACGCGEDVITAGILHDTLEDTDTTPEEIKENFGQKVLEIVQTESEDKSKTWKERKQHTIDDLKKAEEGTQIVCLADKLSNLRSIYADFQTDGNKLWKRFNAPKENIKWYYESVVDALEKDFSSIEAWKELKELTKTVFGDK
jgi:(p)ppGpp synthase/HD superfamily hydrolase|nr:MAG TPA: HD domain [Bacteriophage sp.]